MKLVTQPLTHNQKGLPFNVTEGPVTIYEPSAFNNLVHKAFHFRWLNRPIFRRVSGGLCFRCLFPQCPSRHLPPSAPRLEFARWLHAAGTPAWTKTLRSETPLWQVSTNADSCRDLLRWKTKWQGQPGSYPTSA